MRFSVGACKWNLREKTVLRIDLAIVDVCGWSLEQGWTDGTWQKVFSRKKEPKY